MSEGLYEVCLTLTACDDSTVIRLAATDAEVKFLRRLRDAIEQEDPSNDGSLNGCQPRIQLSSAPRNGWLDEDGDRRWDVMVPSEDGEAPWVDVHVHDGGVFDRTVCPEPCGTMHSYCTVCGVRQDPCTLSDLAR